MKKLGHRFPKFRRLFSLPGPSPASLLIKPPFGKNNASSTSFNLCNLRNLWLKSPAFTLLELLVAMAVMSLLVVMLMGLVDSATRLWRSNENRVESYREARAALNLITTELRTIHSSTNTNFFRLEATAPNGTNDASIAFLTALPLDAQLHDSKSDLCAVGYFLAKGRVSDIGTNSQQMSWNLYRYFKESNDTFAELTNASPTLWPTTLTPTIADTPRTEVEILARNIRSFKVRPLTQNGNNWKVWNQSAANPMPDLLEIEIEAVNTELAKRLGGDLKQTRDDLEAETRRWTTRIPIRQPVATAPTPTPTP